MRGRISLFFSNSFVRISCVIFLLMSCLSANAQDVKVRGGFLSDSLKIGEETAFYLSARYPSDLNVLFPDSTFKFSTFEYTKRNYFQTKTRDNVSVDSAVYYFTTFEVDRAQYLDLPVYVVQPQDCTVFQSPRDSVLITQLVASVPDSLTVDKLPLKMNTAYQKVFFEFNTWVVIIAVGVLIVIAILVWIFFGKRIARYFRVKRLRRMHADFVRNYNAMIAQLQSASGNQAEGALSAWKKYMERLESHPYTKLTTKETALIIRDEELTNNLKEIDRAIYSERPAQINFFEGLRAFADQRFNKKLEEVQHG